MRQALPAERVRGLEQADEVFASFLVPSAWPAVRAWLLGHGRDYLAFVSGETVQVYTDRPLAAPGARQEHSVMMGPDTAAALARIQPAVRPGVVIESSENWR